MTRQHFSTAPTAQGLLDALPASAVVLNASGRIVLANRQWLQFGVDNGGDTASVSPPADYLAVCTPEVRDGIRAVLNGAIHRYETEYPCHGPTIERWFRLTVTPLSQGALVVHQDITGEYERVGRWLATTPTALIELEPGGDAVFANQAWSRYMGAPIRTLLGPGWANRIPDVDRERLVEAVRATCAELTDRTVDVRLPTNEGDIWMRFQLSPYVDDFGRLRRVSLVGMDVTTARRLNDQLAAATERQRIAADIHDVVIQELVAAGMALDNATRDGSLDASMLGDLTRILDRSVTNLRSLAAPLPGGPLRETGLDDAIRSAAFALGFSPAVRADIDLTRLEMQTAAHLVAVLTEALSNIARHARATQAQVLITRDDDDLVLSVRDNGVGMPAAPARRSGTANIARRAEELGGTASWEPASGGGTVLTWRIPLNTG